MRTARGRSALMALPLACLPMLALASTALAQSDPYNGRTFTRTPAVGPPGTVIHVSGTGCSYQGKPYDNAYVTLIGSTFNGPDDQYPIKADGTWLGDYTVPMNASFGDYKLTSNCQAADMVFVGPSQPFTVGYPPTPKPTVAAPPTHPPTPRPTHVSSPAPSPVATPSPNPVALATDLPTPTPSPSEFGRPSTAPISPRGSALGPTFLIIAAVLACAAVVRRVLVRRRR